MPTFPLLFPYVPDSADGDWSVILPGGASIGELKVYAAPAAIVVPPMTHSQDFTYTGAAVTFTVPAGVTIMRAEIWGAQGNALSPSVGGKGAYLNVWFTTTPGESLTVEVGGVGCGPGAGPRAWPDGGLPSFLSPFGAYRGWGGGASSRVRRTTGLTLLAVAGGGGGTGGGDNGGDDGGDAGLVGLDGACGTDSRRRGFGATGLAGGAGGSWGTAAGSPSVDGNAGSSLHGGDGPTAGAGNSDAGSGRRWRRPVRRR